MDANDLLMGSGIKAAKFNSIGDTVLGTITDPPKVEQAKKFGPDNKPTNELDFWPSGDPILNIVAVLQTDQRDPADAEDNGVRRLFVTPRMQNAVRDAVKAAGAPGLEVGGRIAVRWVSGTGVGAGNPRGYAAEYARPVMGVDTMLGTTPPTTAAPAPTAQPAYAAAQAPMLAAPAAQVAPAVSPIQQSMLAGPAEPQRPEQIPVDRWAAMDDSQKRIVIAALSVSATAAPF